LLPDPPEARADEQLFPRDGGHFLISQGYDKRIKDSLIDLYYLQDLQNNIYYMF
jgi:hypothetical protein